MSDVTADDWNHFVLSHPEGTGYHRAEWRTVFERGLGHRCHYLAVLSNGAVRAVCASSKCAAGCSGAR